jgi:hypothetical protein
MSNRAQNPVDELRRLHRFKGGSKSPADALGENMVDFFKQSVVKRQTKFGKIADAWNVLIPEFLCDHCALESFSRGTLVVVVDSSSHLYELKQLASVCLPQYGVEEGHASARAVV